jgi:hypothetical protein
MPARTADWRARKRDTRTDHRGGQRDEPRKRDAREHAVCRPRPPAAIVPVIPGVTICVVLTGSPVKAAMPISAEPTGFAQTPYPNISGCLPRRSPSVRTKRR